MITITLPDGSKKEHEKGILLLDIAKGISEGLARAVLGAVVNGEIKGLQEAVEEDAEVRFVKFEDEEGKEIFWHTSAHLMAFAIQRLFPDTKFAIGPAIDAGFYYDLDNSHVFTSEDLTKLEAEMKKIVKEGYTLERKVVTREEALERFRSIDEDYKIELIENLPEDATISYYQLGDFIDLCKGPHLYDVKKIKAVKLTSIAGAYWRGDENNKMLQRIYGISFPKKSELDEYLERMEEAKKRDHRKIGKEMGLFSMHEEGPGFPFFHPNGMVLRNEIENFLKKELRKSGYGEIKTPMVLNEALWHQSGHWDHYQDNMYFTKIDEKGYAIKPMNCPGSILVYKSNPHSYRELPIRVAEFGQVHRHELSGALHGLMRVRTFTQDDAHIYCLPEQIEEEVTSIIKFCDYIYSIFGFEYNVELSTRPEDSMGKDEDWEIATKSLETALVNNNLEFKVNEGDGAFYGPKIDFHLKDAIGRVWQCGTIQLDFQMPERFGLEYINQEGVKSQPVMIHRAVVGSIERFMGILIEHFAGKFPLWIAPVQAIILPISDKYNEKAEELRLRFEEEGIRTEVDDRSEKIGFKIREAQLNKIPYSLVLGEKEIENNTVALRIRDLGDQGVISTEEFIKMAQEKIKSKEIDL